jgi:hypothetical protein
MDGSSHGLIWDTPRIFFDEPIQNPHTWQWPRWDLNPVPLNAELLSATHWTATFGFHVLFHRIWCSLSRTHSSNSDASKCRHAYYFLQNYVLTCGTPLSKGVCMLYPVGSPFKSACSPPYLVCLINFQLLKERSACVQHSYATYTAAVS